MATAMAQAPGDRRTHQWDEIQAQIARVKSCEDVLAGNRSIDDLVQEEKTTLQGMLKGIFVGDEDSLLDSPKGRTPTRTDEATSLPPRTSRRYTRAEGGVTKKEFIEGLLQKDPELSLRDINAAWKKAGNKDTISASLVYKTKSDLKTRSGRRGGGRAASKTQGKETSASSHVNQPAGGDLHAEVQRAAWEILSRDEHKDGLQVAQITEIIEAEGLVSGLGEGNDLANIVQIELKRLREEGKAERGDNRQYHLVEGSMLN